MVNIFGTHSAVKSVRIYSSPLVNLTIKECIMMKSKLLNSLILAALAAPVVANAAAPTLSEVLDASGVSLTGYIDTGYTSLNSTGLFTSGVSTRVFDAPSAVAGKNFNSFNLNQAAVTISKLPKEGAGGVVNLTTGQDAKAIVSNGAPASQFDVTQAYGSYATGSMTIIFGKFVTLSGAEVITSTANPNYSRSILFGYAIPFTHTGARVSYAVSDTVNLIAGVNNGWDQVSDMNTGKTVELGFTAAPSKMFALAGSYYSGKEMGATINGNRSLLDLVATINATDQLSFIVNYDSASQDDAMVIGSKAKWNGLAAYANYAINDSWHLSLRGEAFNDKDGYRTGIVQKWKEATLTAAYLPSKSLELRAEVRKDSSDQLAFQQSDGSAKKSQNSLGLQALYKF
jgi:hypothetical protein